MKPEFILQSDVLDILFENRNKVYGAYSIRRHYNAHLLKALMTMFVIIGMVLLLVTRRGTDMPGSVLAIPPIPPVTPFHPVQTVKFDPPPSVHLSVKKAASQHFASVRIVPPTEPVDEPLPDIAEMAEKQIALISSTGNNLGNMILPPNAEDATASASTVYEPQHEQPYSGNTVDEAAEYPGGRKALHRFLVTHLHHPALENSEPLKMSIRFVVAEDGSVGSFFVIRSGGEDVDREVIKVLQKMPRWKPAKKNGKYVAMYFVQSVSFEVIKD